MKIIIPFFCCILLLCAGCYPVQGFAEVHATLSPLVEEVHVLETVVFVTATLQTPTGTPTLTGTPVPTATPTLLPPKTSTPTPTPSIIHAMETSEPTATIRPSLVIPPETWYKLVNTGRFPSLWLYVLNPGDGGFWVYGEDNRPIVNQPLDWYGWHRVDVSGRRADGSGCDPCWLWASQSVELLEVRWRMTP